jgi:hypothetical protein
LRRSTPYASRVLGKKGSLTALLKSLGSLEPERAAPLRPGDQRRARC